MVSSEFTPLALRSSAVALAASLAFSTMRRSSRGLVKEGRELAERWSHTTRTTARRRGGLVHSASAVSPRGRGRLAFRRTSPRGQRRAFSSTACLIQLFRLTPKAPAERAAR